MVQSVYDSEFSLEVDEQGAEELNHEGKEVIDEAMFLVSGREACGLPGLRAC